MPAGFSLKVKITTNPRITKMISEWPKRMTKVQEMLAYKSAMHLKSHLQAKLKGKQNRNYRQSLEVARVSGTKIGEYAYAVQEDPKSRFARTVKVHGELLTVYATDRMSRKSEAVQILIQHNPWTFESLPFKPDRKDGYLVAKKARPQEVYRVTRQRQRERSVWGRALQRQGVRVSRANSLAIPRNISALPDVAMDALRQEFGLGGGKPQPSWRVGMSQLKRHGFKSILKDKNMFASPMTNPSFTLWKRYPSRTKHTVSVSGAKRYKGFQDKISPKGGGG